MGHTKDIQDPHYQFAKCICGCTFFIIFFPPTIWLTLVIVDQTEVQCSIQDFYIASNSTNQSIIYFDLKLQNEAKDMGVYYDTLNLTFSYYVDPNSNPNLNRNPNPNPNPNPSSGIIRIANYTIHGFHQGEGKQTHRKDYVLTPGFYWENISSNGSLSKAVFRVDLASRVRFKDFAWKGRRHTLMAWADVEVNGITGKKVKKKGITLKKMNTHHINGWAIFGVIFLALAIFLSPCWCFLLLALICP